MFSLLFNLFFDTQNPTFSRTPYENKKELKAFIVLFDKDRELLYIKCP